MSDVADAADLDLDDEIDETEIAEADGDDKPSGRKKLIIMAAAGVLVLGGLGGAAFHFGLFSGGESSSENPELTQVFFYPLPEMTVNLASTGGRAQYLKVRVSLEMSDRAALRAIPPVEPRIMDAFQIHLRELRASDLEGSMGIFRMKEELLRRVNLAIHPLKVNRVLFNEMLIQ